MSIPSGSEVALGVVIAVIVAVAIGMIVILPELMSKRRRQVLAQPSGEEDRGPSVGTPTDVP
jgi:hypothetical protein